MKHFKMLCRLYRMTRSNLESQNWNFQFTLTESSYICILTSEFIANWFFKCLKNTVQLRSLFVTSLCIFSPKALQMLSKTHRSAWIKNNFIFSSVTHFYWAHFHFQLISKHYLPEDSTTSPQTKKQKYPW